MSHPFRKNENRINKEKNRRSDAPETTKIRRCRQRRRWNSWLLSRDYRSASPDMVAIHATIQEQESSHIQEFTPDYEQFGRSRQINLCNEADFPVESERSLQPEQPPLRSAGHGGRFQRVRDLQDGKDQDCRSLMPMEPLQDSGQVALRFTLKGPAECVRPGRPLRPGRPAIGHVHW